MVEELWDGVTETQILQKTLKKIVTGEKLSMIMVWEHYCNASPKPEFFLVFFVYIFIHILANMSPFGLKFSQMILPYRNKSTDVQVILSLCSFAQANTLTQYL